MATFGNVVKTEREKEREKRNWTQTEFGAQMGINSSTVSRIENGSKQFSTSKLKLLSKAFQVDYQNLNDLFFADKFAREAKKINIPMPFL